ncbi:hypothetical protein GCM10010967_25910 [Dyadobacter beijingensis]|uniref:Spi protease inhibitor domain-containing protein n=1 Tax=Dyadobacter beijingensis TaxID=365489 RepID=A0ABQ2HU82_9BACT|nr:C10 family peptidase [Dyadobacter beijingensis]GGM91688.1 hypothetical protein GCM10010967_25910 [Dyadobacter beijingensis]
MKHINKILLAILAACALFQCRQETSSPAPEAQANALVVTAKEAQKLASGDLSTTENAASRTSATATGPTKRIKSIRTLDDDEGNPLMHIIHFESDTHPDAGFVIIAGDRRVIPILAKGDSGTFNPDGENPGPRIWIEHVKLEVEAGKKEVATPEKGVELMWRKLAEGTPLTGGRTTDQEPIDPTDCPQDTYYSSGMLITSHWRSTEAYSMYCPSKSCDGCSTANAGCGAVAIAQVWNAPCNQKPATYSIAPGPVTNYNFPLNNTISTNACTSNLPADQQIANMIRVAGMYAGSNYNIAGCNTFTWRENIKTAFQAAGYSNPGKRAAFSSVMDNVKGELMTGHPVIMDGTNQFLGFQNWHIWVIAGIQETVLHGVVELNGYPTCMAWTYNMYYLNWGWGDDDDNWYALGNFVGDGHNYDTYLNVTYGMRK